MVHRYLEWWKSQVWVERMFWVVQLCKYLNKKRVSSMKHSPLREVNSDCPHPALCLRRSELNESRERLIEIEVGWVRHWESAVEHDVEGAKVDNLWTLANSVFLRRHRFWIASSCIKERRSQYLFTSDYLSKFRYEFSWWGFLKSWNYLHSMRTDKSIICDTTLNSNFSSGWIYWKQLVSQLYLSSIYILESMNHNALHAICVCRKCIN